MPSPGEDVQAWSTSATLNNSSDPSINWAEGQPRASVNNSARAMMAALAKDRDLRNGSIVTSGTANAQTFFSGLNYTSIPTGLSAGLKIGTGLTNTAAATINMDAIGAVAIKDQFGNDLVPGELRENTFVSLRYDGTNWVLTANFRAAGQSKWTIAVLTASNATWPVPTDTTEMQIECWGGGGGGGGAFAGSPNNSRGGGGAGGGYVLKHFAGVMDATLNVTVGAGGGGAGDGSQGASGASSIVVGTNLGTLTAGGGAGGYSTVGGGAGGGGGSATGGDLNINGGDGCVSPGGGGSGVGFGGSSPRGGSGGISNVGAAGIIPGGGGAGANHVAGAGGAGAAGRVVIWTR